MALLISNTLTQSDIANGDKPYRCFACGRKFSIDGGTGGGLGPHFLGRGRGS